MSPARIIIGAQWGDEGKGKMMDLLAQQADMVVRYQGGSNAGHTIFKGDQAVKLHQIPSGILNPKTLCVLGNGMVINLQGLVEELETLSQAEIDTSGLRVSGLAHVVLSSHRIMDRVMEAQRGNRIGTTGKGIGPAYADKASRLGIRFWDLLHPAELQAKLEDLVSLQNRILEGAFGEAPLDVEAIKAECLHYGERIAPYITDASLLINRYLDEGKQVLFEGAQGTMLDLDFGTYPYVTSSSTLTGGACTGAGIAPTRISEVIGVSKAYTTRVGEGPFPTEIQGEIEGLIREIGQEYGTTTGRPRRCGWLDLVALRYAVRLNGLTSLIITKLDVLDSLAQVGLAVGYRLDGEFIQDFPSDPHLLKRCEPVYEYLPGWQSRTRNAKSIQDLPYEARQYLRRISQALGIPISLVSVGPRREETVCLEAAVKAMAVSR